MDKNDPLVVPEIFEEKAGPQYRKITYLLNEHGINIICLDCVWVNRLAYSHYTWSSRNE